MLNGVVGTWVAVGNRRYDMLVDGGMTMKDLDALPSHSGVRFNGKSDHPANPLVGKFETKGGHLMSTIKVIEILAQSPKSWEDAANRAVRSASQSIRDIRSIYIKYFEATVENNEITNYRINAKISFGVEEREAGGRRGGSKDAEAGATGGYGTGGGYGGEGNI